MSEYKKGYKDGIVRYPTTVSEKGAAYNGIIDTMSEVKSLLEGVDESGKWTEMFSSLDSALKQWVEEQNYLKEHQDISEKIDKADAYDFSAILSLAVSLGGAVSTSSTEWKFSVADGAGNIVLGKKQDNTWWKNPETTFEDILDIIINSQDPLKKVENIDSDTTVAEVVGDGLQMNVIYMNTGSTTVTVTADHTIYKTPDNEDIELSIDAGCYGELNFLNIDGLTYVRGA